MKLSQQESQYGVWAKDLGFDRRDPAFRALCVVTGAPYREIRRAADQSGIAAVRLDRAWHWEVLASLGFSAQPIAFNLGQLALTLVPQLDPGRRYLLYLNRHVLPVRTGAVIGWRRSLRWPVHAAYEVTRP